jgi:hypothetical protein
VFEGAINGPTLLTYVKECLVPTLKRSDIVVMDNLPVHKIADVAEAIEAAARCCFIVRRTRQTSIRSSRPSVK